MGENNIEQKIRKWSSLSKAEQKEINSEFRSQQVSFIVLKYSFLAIYLIAIVVLMILHEKKLIDIVTNLVILGIVAGTGIPLNSLIVKTYQKRHKEFLKSNNIELDTQYGIWF